MAEVIEFEKLSESDLIPGNVYEGGKRGNVGDDPFNKLLGTGNAGGIRSKISKKTQKQAYIVIIADENNSSYYEDKFDEKTQVLTYAGDQRDSEKDYLDTRQKGNQKLELLYKTVYNNKKEISETAFPIFYFQKISGAGRNYRYIGMAYPFVEKQDLNTVCSKTNYQNKQGETINNLIFQFTIDTSSVVLREWINDLSEGANINTNAPKRWRDFLTTGAINIVTEEAISQALEDVVLYETIIQTEVVEVIAKGRRGQEKLRDLLMEKEKGCKLCGLQTRNLLIASHIIPWSEAERQEIIDEFGSQTRGDINNVLLLCANHDKLFDNYLITFDETNKLLISPHISVDEIQNLNLDSNIQYNFSEKQQQYLAKHREKFKLNNQ